MTRGNKSLWLGLGLGLLVGAAVVSGVVVLVNDGDDDSGGTAGGRSNATTSTTTDDTTAAVDLNALGDAGRELLALLEQAKEATFHARYVAVRGPELTIELWSEPPQLRQDTHVPSRGAEVREIHDSNEIVACISRSNAWTCTETNRSGVLYVALEKQLVGKEISATDGVVGRWLGRCFTLSSPEKPALDLCFTDGGVPTRIQSGNSTMELEVLDQEFPSDLYEPPVEPVGG